MRSATRELVNAHGSAALVRRLSPNLSRAIALTIVGLALVVSSSVALAAGLTVGLVVPSVGDLTCDAFACTGTVVGNLSGSTPGTYTLQLALDMPFGDFSDSAITQICLTPTSGETNQAVLNFTGVGATGQVVLTTDVLCVPKDIGHDPNQPPPITKFSLPFSVHSGDQDFLGANGTGTLEGQFPGSILGASLTVLSLNSSDFNVPVLGCTDPNGCNGNPTPGATPELDSILLFGSGLSGLVAYAVRRRRAGKLRG
jgi:hypothetical protein